ncbi:MAG: winged helix DNA-binding domain-containing protein [Acidimicrobiia bacterium]|nr:winged helix DNA-binding domain-containing protein [Acidimicrobiia bacterium]MDH4306156.1 winged helix DNA-binding domain-containing protein [Acidimicrobiia bacterium]MDH5292098.1 winged helix DNA-binding domain-containing protein [Acidimicrobiia bacterium]
MRLSIGTARRIALAAQGFGSGRPGGRIDVRHFRRVVDSVKVVQLDSVNVVARAHYLPFFSRLGAYPVEKLDQWLWRSGEMFEYWAHEASLVPVGQRPLLTHRMNGGWHWESIERIGRDNPGYVDRVLQAVREEGPLRAADVEGHRRADSWWGWGDAKIALEHLFLTGLITASDRIGFQRIYDLPERVHPEAVALGTREPDDAKTELLALAAQAVGVGTIHDLADYYRMKIGDARRLLPGLVRRGDVIEANVDGWTQPAYLHASAVRPRSIRTSALLAPFDPVVWNRERAERLFGFRYRIEIYVPAAKRTYGYYVLPFLLDDRLVARVDLKADRGAGKLIVRAAHGEDGVDTARVAGALGAECAEMATWLGLDDVEVEERGDLATRLRRAFDL